MIYKGYRVRATVPEWHCFEVNEDGNFGLDRGGVDFNWGAAEYEFYTDDERDEPVDGNFETLAKALAAIDKRVAA